jgi:hypothetical protein
LRRVPLEERKPILGESAREPRPGIALNEYYVGEGDVAYRHACKLGCRASCRSGSARCTALRRKSFTGKGYGVSASREQKKSIPL